jgi:hypothetical protein
VAVPAVSIDVAGEGSTVLRLTLPADWPALLDAHFDAADWGRLGDLLGAYAAEKPWKHGAEILGAMAADELPDLAGWSCSHCLEAFDDRSAALDHDCPES